MVKLCYGCQELLILQLCEFIDVVGVDLLGINTPDLTNSNQKPISNEISSYLCHHEQDRLPSSRRAGVHHLSPIG